MDKAISQPEHWKTNSKKYPGTMQICFECDAPTDKCEEDALYDDNNIGPLCGDCMSKREWYCENCNQYLIPENVNYEETCSYCGSDVEYVLEEEG